MYHYSFWVQKKKRSITDGWLTSSSTTTRTINSWHRGYHWNFIMNNRDARMNVMIAVDSNNFSYNFEKTLLKKCMLLRKNCHHSKSLIYILHGLRISSEELLRKSPATLVIGAQIQHCFRGYTMLIYGFLVYGK